MLTSTVRWLLGQVPLPVYRLVLQRRVLGLYYHVVSNEPLPHVRHLYPYKTPRMFEDDLLYLAHGYSLITYEHLAAHYRRAQRLAPRSAILTFDDGLAECYSEVRPLLLRHGVPCVFFVTTDYIDNRRMGYDHKASLCIESLGSLEGGALSNAVASVGGVFDKELSSGIELMAWVKSIAVSQPSTIDRLCRELRMDVDGYLAFRHPYLTSDEIRRLAADGFTIGAHSVSHRRLGSLTEQEVEEEIAGSCRMIAELTGQPQVPFAFPFSADGIPRELLRTIRSRHEHVGMFFGTAELRRDRGEIVNRICGDWPDGSDTRTSNLPRRLARAYVEELALRVRGA